MPYQRFLTKVKSGLQLIPQPNAYTCQSACIAMATDRNDTVDQVRAELVRIGEPGNPYVMGKILARECAGRYSFYDNASLSMAREWLKLGDFLITHGWFTRSGHVICLRGVDVDPETLSYKFEVNDPWSEFDAISWSYNLKAYGFQGIYSSRLIYAACVASTSYWNAAKIYDSKELLSDRKGMWIHRIRA